jgi:hypothetical protein
VIKKGGKTVGRAKRAVVVVVGSFVICKYRWLVMLLAGLAGEREREKKEAGMIYTAFVTHHLGKKLLILPFG